MAERAKLQSLEADETRTETAIIYLDLLKKPHVKDSLDMGKKNLVAIETNQELESCKELLNGANTIGGVPRTSPKVKWEQEFIEFDTIIEAF
ncbi:hypothetical protein CEXT_258901 [Caerostris extrusa]|uniref:Uncharacterized protein n=1 Tax=Caerostris extrusa TaxID=172846 RepID=A0AAV4WMF9_CAEEX|nr:hypothetical protein CEXT_258901 [Caerostris extrusa]